MGRIGSELAKKCTALGMKIIYFDLMDIKNIDNNYRKVEFDELLRKSDFISINISGTKSIIGSEELKRLKREPL